MPIQAQALILTLIILSSLAVTKAGRVGAPSASEPASPSPQTDALASVATPRLEPYLDFERAILAGGGREEGDAPQRKWEILDPHLTAEAVIVQSLDTNFPFLHYGTYKIWPVASITKFLTALVVLDEVGINTKIPISSAAVGAPGGPRVLTSGEIYTARDLLKILLISSSNGAAVAFEDYVGSRDRFLELMHAKARQIGMNQSVFFDASGLSDLNQSSANDILKLLKYIVENRPEILAWTRTSELLVRPTNIQFVESKNIRNVNELVENPNFLGGKTGTLPQARQNLAAVMSMNDDRVAVIILGSPNRMVELERIFEWIGRAYAF